MPTIGNMPGADLEVQFPSGTAKTVNMIVLLAETIDAEVMATHGHHMARNARTIKELRAKYELDYFFDGPVRTWEDCAAVMRHFHTLCSEHIHAA